MHSGSNGDKGVGLHMKKRSNRTNVYVCVSIGLMAFIFCMSQMPAEQSGNLSGWVVTLLEKIVPPLQGLTGSEREGAMLILSFLVRKGAHFAEYALLGGFVAAATHSCGKYGVFKAVIISIAIGAAYAVTDELHQYFVPGRVASASDVGVDSLGVVAGAVIATLADRARRSTR
jgi:VanZ family protein